MSKTVAEILDAAAALIEPEGMWGQGVSGGCRGQHCADTAIYRVANDLTLGERDDVRRFFAKLIGGDTHWDTFRWNDAPERTQAEVVAKLREAAELARSFKSEGTGS